MHYKLHSESGINKTSKLLSDSLAVNNFFKALSFCHFYPPVRKTKRIVCGLFPYRSGQKILPPTWKRSALRKCLKFQTLYSPNGVHRLKAGSLKFRLNSLKLIIIGIECFGRESIVFTSSFNHLSRAG